jgi:molecular chaperone DnaK
MEGKTSCIIENSEGTQKTLSVIAFSKCGEHLVSLPAKQQAVVNAVDTVFAFKHLISQKFNNKEVKEVAEH